MKYLFGAVAFAFLAATAVAAPDADVKSLVRAINAVGPEGAGNAEAARAWRELINRPAADLLQLLAAFDDASPMAANWLCAAVDAVVQREKSAGRPLVAADLRAFLQDTRHSGHGRRLAYELLCDIEPAAKKRFLAAFVDDPAAELRYEAVADRFAAIKEQPVDSPSAKAELRKLLASARDARQVEDVARELQRRGEKIDLVAHFGYITRWQVAGVFDNADGRGYVTAYPPETGVHLTDRYRGKEGTDVAWRPVVAGKEGYVDLNASFPDPAGKRKGRAAVVAYAYAEIESAEERAVHVRASSATAIKVFLNGCEVLARELYHQNFDRDLLTAPARLGRGRNTILVKVCQNEQPEPFAQNWMFQLRLTDALGAAVPIEVVTPGMDGGGRK